MFDPKPYEVTLPEELQEQARKMYAEAIQCQDAPNLSGLALSLSNNTLELWKQARALGQGTRWVNQHPVVRMFLNQMSFLAGNGEMIRFADYSDLEDFCKARQ